MNMESANVRINACRICLDTRYSKSVSFDDDEGWLRKMYEFCFGLTVLPQDIPRKLCGVCVKKMKSFSKLKKQSLKADTLWRTVISVQSVSLQNSIEVEYFVKEENSYISNIGKADNDLNECYSHIKNEESDSPLNDITDDILENEDTFAMEFEVDKEEKCSIKNELDEEYLIPNIERENVLKDVNKNKKIKCFEQPINKYKKGKRRYVCQRCNKTFQYNKSYTTHVLKNNCKLETNPEKSNKIKKKSQSEFFCGLCNEKSVNSADIKRHLNTHSSENDLSCKLCEFIGRDFANMEAHRYFHQPDQSIECHSCGKTSRSVRLLEYHYRSVHLGKPGGYCSLCNKEYNCYKPWRNHTKWHTSANYICDHCGKRYLFRNGIVAHLKDHDSYRGYICDICGKNFKRTSSLNVHKQHVHDDKKVKCSHCNKMFKNQQNLQKHMQREARERKYQCEICLKSYVLPGLLAQHMIWHTNERPYSCDTCGSAYKVKGQLTIHMRSHTGILPYKCPVAQCPKAFAASNQLKVHMRVHSGIRRYKCQFCEKTFHNKSHVVVHYAKRHNVTDVPVDTSRKHLNKPES